MTEKHDMEKLCRLIAQLPPLASAEEVQQALDPWFAADYPTDDNTTMTTTITPWIMACDKAQVACLQYLERQYRDHYGKNALLGDPTTAAADTGNTPAHHAAAANCFDALLVLERAAMVLQQHKQQQNQTNHSTLLLDLLSTCNAHGDTPLMMAAAEGHIDFLQSVFCKRMFDNNHAHIWSAINNDQDTCLTLATRSGHVDVVKFLLSTVSVTGAEHEQCRKALAAVQRAVRTLERPSTTVNEGKVQTLSRHLTALQTCCKLVEQALTDQAEAAALELLNEQGTLPCQKQAKHKRERKQKRNTVKHAVGDARTAAATIETKTHETSSTSLIAKDDDQVKVTTLSDGRRAVRVQGSENNDDSNNGNEFVVQLLSTENVDRRPPSVDEMFRQRLHERGAAGHLDNTASCTHVDAVMQALCLDPSMLLYTPHGMALQLSPSQLDAVQGILERQLNAVGEARQLQERRARVNVCSSTATNQAEDEERSEDRV